MVTWRLISSCDQWEDFLTIMPVEINHWRATIGCFNVSIKICLPWAKLLTHFQLFPKFFSYIGFVLVSPQSQSLPCPAPYTNDAVFCIVLCNKTCTLFPLFARVHRFAKTVIYTNIELIRRIPFGIAGLFRYKYRSVKQFLLLYTYLYTGCIRCNTLHTHNGWSSGAFC